MMCGGVVELDGRCWRTELVTAMVMVKMREMLHEGMRCVLHEQDRRCMTDRHA